MDSRFIIRINPTKAVFTLSFLYSNIISIKLFAIPGFSFGLLALSLLMVIISKKHYLKDAYRNRSVMAYFIFVFISSITSIVVSNNLSVALSSINNLIEFGMMLIIILTISIEDGNLNYCINLFLIYSLILCALIFLDPIPFSEITTRTVYLTIAPGVNPHTVGIVLTIGIWCYMVNIGQGEHKSLWRVIISAILMIAMFAATVLTNSRKSIIGIAIILIFTTIPYIRTAIKRMGSIGKLMFPIVIIAVLIYCFNNPQYIMSIFEKNDILLRFQEMDGNSNQSRIAMIIEAFNVFCDHPILGVGLNNFREYSSYRAYSHNTYSEILACCGVLGTIPFAYMLGKICFSVFSRIRQNKENYIEMYFNRLFCVLAVLILYTGFSQIIFYSRELMYAVALCIAYNMLQRQYNSWDKI